MSIERVMFEILLVIVVLLGLFSGVLIFGPLIHENLKEVLERVRM